MWFKLESYFVRGLTKCQPKVVVDGLLLTGQNPGSSSPLGEEILKALQM
jgi:putative intracellular protease/amidase